MTTKYYHLCDVSTKHGVTSDPTYGVRFHYISIELDHETPTTMTTSYPQDPYILTPDKESSSEWGWLLYAARNGRLSPGTSLWKSVGKIACLFFIHVIAVNTKDEEDLFLAYQSSRLNEKSQTLPEAAWMLRAHTFLPDNPSEYEKLRGLLNYNFMEARVKANAQRDKYVENWNRFEKEQMAIIRKRGNGDQVFVEHEIFKLKKEGEKWMMEKGAYCLMVEIDASGLWSCGDVPHAKILEL